MHRRHPPRQILPPLPGNRKPRLHNHVPKLPLAREPLNALHQVLVTLPVPRHQLPNQRNRPERPLPVRRREQRRPPVRLAKLQARKHAARLQHAVRFPQRRRDVAEVADAEGDGVEVDRGVRDRGGRGGGRGEEGFGGGEVFGVGAEEGQGRLLARGEERRALFADREHGRVDVGDGHAHRGVGVEDVRGVQHAEGDVAGAAGDVEDVLRGAGVRAGGQGGEARVEGGDEVVSAGGRLERGVEGLGGERGNGLPDAVPAKGHEVVHAVVGFGDAGEDAGDALALFGLGDGLIAKVCWAGWVGDRIVGCWVGIGGRREGGGG